MLFRSLARLAAVVVAAGGCFGPDIPDGRVRCGPAGECPSALTCVNGRCSKGGPGTVDAGGQPDAALVFDAPAGVDARSDAAAADAAPPDGGSDAGGGNLSINFLGTGAGKVTANQSTCTSDCPLSFPAGTSVVLSATPALGSLFVGWSGACTGTGSCTIVADAAGKTVEATFIPVASVQLLITTTGPGSISPEPAGASCGTGCQAYASGTPVKLNPVPDPGFSFISWSGGGCDSAGTASCNLVLNGNTTVTGRFCTSQRVVDASLGMDSFEGTCARPFRTITRGLSVALNGQLVSVRPGVYSATLGEVFPLLVPDGVRLVGDEAQKGGATRIEGGGPVTGSPALRAAVVVGARATLAGFVILNAATLPNSNGVVVTKPSPGSADSAVIRNNTVTGCGTDGIYLERARLVQIDGNVVTDQDTGGTGVRVTSDATGANLERNVIVRNSYGVEVDADADLGGGNRQSAGRNTFSCNLEIDVLASGSTSLLTVTANNNFWDHVPPFALDACASNLDLCRDNASVSVTGALLTPSPCN